MENQDSSVNTEVSFDVTEITADDINMEDIVDTFTQKSSSIAKKAIGMNKSQITTLALNLLSTDSRIRSSGIYVLGMKPCILCREIETLITQDLFKEMDKPTTLTTEDTASKQVYSENPTPVGENADKIYMNQLGLFSGEEQSSSKTAEVAKETSDQATSPIEVVSTTPGNSENVYVISKDSSGQIQRPICEKCSEDITIDFQKDTVFLSCSHAVHLDCINDLRKRCPTCSSADDMETDDLRTLASSTAQKCSNDSGESTEKSSSKKVKKAGF
ncbi:unnamed protein product [Rhizophagus irregularis]|nr:unnamed protein product [Rhizophagus irregularis]